MNKAKKRVLFICAYGSLVKRSRRRPLTAETGVRFPYQLLFKTLKDPVFMRASRFFVFALILRGNQKGNPSLWH